MREITEYDGYKINLNFRDKSKMSEEELKAYEAEKAEAKRKAEEILKSLKENNAAKAR